MNSRCELYKSAIEEVTIWGWPLQTAGMITTGMSFRTLTILSGRVTEVNFPKCFPFLFDLSLIEITDTGTRHDTMH